MKTVILSALLTLVISTPAFAQPWWSGGNWGIPGWNIGGDDDWDDDWRDWDDDDWDDDDEWDNRRAPRNYRARNGSYYFGRVYIDSNRGWGFVRGTGGPPAGYELAEMDYRSLRRAVLDATTEFDRWLGGIPTGEVWRKHFETRTLSSSLSSGAEVPTFSEQETASRVLETFNRALENPDLRELTRTDSFRSLHFSLREFAMPARERLTRQLSFSARRLNRSLDPINTGASWRKYLALPDAVLAAAERLPGEAVSRESLDAAELERILERYDGIQRNPEYRAIHSLPEFQVTHQRLAALVAAGRASPVPLVSPAEELPPPPEPRGR